VVRLAHRQFFPEELLLTLEFYGFTVEKREAAAYDERTTLDGIIPKGVATLRAHLKHLHEHGQTTYLNQALAHLKELGQAVPEYREKIAHQGCPGSAPRSFVRVPDAAANRVGLTSQLAQWPVQLHLISPMNPVFQGADLLLAADCRENPFPSIPVPASGNTATDDTAGCCKTQSTLPTPPWPPGYYRILL